MQGKRALQNFYVSISSNESSQEVAQGPEIPQTVEEKMIKIGQGSRTPQQNHLMIYYLHKLKSQLPNMPCHHLISILFSNRHSTLLLAKFEHDSPIEILGGLTYCKICSNTAIQLTFMASSTIKKGYGSKLIDHFKNCSLAEGISSIFTHADNNATQFYRKNGFIKINDTYRQIQESTYVNSTLMFCKISYKRSYQNLRNKIKHSSENLRSQIKQKMIGSHLGEYYRPKQIKSSEQYFNLDNYYFNINPKQLESDLIKNQFRKLKETKQQKIYRNYTIYIDRLISMACDKIIEIQPQLRELSIWEYEEPIDLKTLREKAVAGQYKSQNDFFQDIKKVFINSRKLYQEEDEIIENIDKLFQELRLLEEERQMIGDN